MTRGRLSNPTRGRWVFVVLIIVCCVVIMVGSKLLLPERVPAASVITEPVEAPPGPPDPSPQPPVSSPELIFEPPIPEPPILEPPILESAIFEPPTAEPPTAEPPTTEPSTVVPGITETPIEQPPVAQPPTAEPPTAEPPTAEPPTAEPPTAEPPTAEPPAPDPTKDELGNKERDQEPPSAPPSLTATVPSVITPMPPASATPPEQPPRGDTPGDDCIISATGGRVYCGLQQSSVWLELPRNYSNQECITFQCVPTSVAGAWDGRGYLIDFSPPTASVLKPLTMVHEIDPARAGGAFTARYSEADSDRWQDLPSALDTGTLRLQVELAESLPIFDSPGRYAVALFVQAATPTFTPMPGSAQQSGGASPQLEPTAAIAADLTPPGPAATPSAGTPVGATTTQTDVNEMDEGGLATEVWFMLGLGSIVVIAMIVLVVLLMRTQRAVPGEQPQRPVEAVLQAVQPGARPVESGSVPPVPVGQTREAVAHSVETGELRLVRGQAQPSHLRLSEAAVRIGRSRQRNHVIVSDPLVSGHHAEFLWHNGMHFIQDLASTNGTFLNGRRISQPRPLRDGDRIAMGNTEWLYQRLGDTARLRRL